MGWRIRIGRSSRYISGVRLLGFVGTYRRSRGCANGMPTKTAGSVLVCSKGINYFLMIAGLPLFGFWVKSRPIRVVGKTRYAVDGVGTLEAELIPDVHRGADGAENGRFSIMYSKRSGLRRAASRFR